MAGLSYAQLVIIGIAAGAAMIFGGIMMFNSIASVAYANTTTVTVALTMASVGALLFFASLYSVVRDIFRIESENHGRHGHEEHEGHHKKE